MCDANTQQHAAAKNLVSRFGSLKESIRGVTPSFSINSKTLFSVKFF